MSAIGHCLPSNLAHAIDTAPLMMRFLCPSGHDLTLQPLASRNMNSISGLRAAQDTYDQVIDQHPTYKEPSVNYSRI